jgi:hypothetical protein
LPEQAEKGWETRSGHASIEVVKVSPTVILTVEIPKAKKGKEEKAKGGRTKVEG